jgi:hypothetical protein
MESKALMLLVTGDEMARLKAGRRVTPTVIGSPLPVVRAKGPAPASEEIDVREVITLVPPGPICARRVTLEIDASCA